MPDLLISALLAVPLFWGILSLLTPRPAGPLLTGFGALLELALAVALWWQLREHGSQTYALGGWPAPLGITLRIDGLAVTFLLLAAVVAAACAFHAQLYLRGKAVSQRHFWPLFWLLWAGLNGIWLSADLFNLYVCLELVALSSVGLVALTGEPDALAAALRYLLAALLGSLAYLLGVGLLYGGYGSLAMTTLAGQIEPEPTAFVAFALMTVGLLFKTALFPLHGWLPPAHGGALSPVSAMLSALVIKSAFYILARLWLDLGDGVVARPMANALGVLGTLAIFWGSWEAFRQQQLKWVVAYSTVAQVGYFFLLFPLVTGTSAEAFQLARDGMVLLLVTHALAKAAMFLAAGNLILSVGRDTVDGLEGVSRFLPLSLFSFGLAGVNLMGLPPSGGFTGKWLLLQSALASGQWWWGAVLLLGGLATAAYLFRIFARAFREGPEKDVFEHPPRTMELVPMTLAVAATLLGLVAAEPLAVLDLHLPVGERG